MKTMPPKSKAKGFKARRTKLNLVFNEEKRREFLTGFHKRKLQRKKIAKEKLEQDLKEEKKRLKAEAKESYKKLVKSHAPIPEIEDLLAEEYENEEVNVKVVELSASEIANQNNWIGINQPSYEADEVESEEESKSDEDIPGMELKTTKKPTSKVVKEPNSGERKSKGEIKKILKKQATKNVQKSKAFQMKNKIEKQKQKKQSLQKKKMRMKLQSRSGKNRKGNR